MNKSRTLPYNMGLKECWSLVFSSYSYFEGQKGVGEAVCYIWKMPPLLEQAVANTIRAEDAVECIMAWQKTQKIQ